jgi:4-amino-4-deoxy-L-arabinose transferase-like glycosyltransferase
VATTRLERWALAGLLLAAAGLRVVVWQRSVAMFSDGPRFLGMAHAFDSGRWTLALNDAYHPLYPLLVALLHRILPFGDSAGGWEGAAAAVSVASGVAVVGLGFAFLRDAFGAGAAWVGAFLLAVQTRSVDFTSDVQSDGLYLALFVAGTWLGWRAWRRGSPAWAAGAGLAVGLAYTTRPEGLGLGLALGLLGLLQAVVTAPTRAARAARAAQMLLRTVVDGLRLPIVALVALGLAGALGRPGPRALFTATLTGLYAVLLYALTLSSGYVSRRHTLPPLVPLFGYAGLGALAAGAWAARWVRPGRRSARVLATAVLVAGVGAGEVAGLLQPRRSEELATRRAADWLRQHAPEPGPLAAPRQRLGYYADMPYLPLAGIADEALGRYLSRAGARYVLLDDPAQVDALLREEGDRVRLLHRVRAGGHEAWVLECAGEGAPASSSAAPSAGSAPRAPTGH